MDLMVSAEDGVIGPDGLSVALHWLAEAPVGPRQVSCLGLQLVDFSDAAWHEALCWLAHDPSARVSRHEVEHAARFVHCADAVRHLLGRSLLRHVFARHGRGHPPDCWPVNDWGKPYGGAWDLGGSELHFNLSHAGSEVWMACSTEAPVGIDVELAAPTPDDLLAVIHPAEAADLRRDGSASRCRRLWTRKEAVVKAAGEGLSLPLDAFRVAVDPQPVGWLIEPPAAYRTPWSTADVPVAGAGMVAMAARGGDLVLTWRRACVRVRA